MTTEMPEKWTTNSDGSSVIIEAKSARIRFALYPGVGKAIADQHNADVESAYRAGLEAGWAEAKAAKSEPAPESPAVRDMTDAEKAVWGQVYAAVIGQASESPHSWDSLEKIAIGRADTAVLAMRERCRKPGIAYQGQSNPDIQAALETIIDGARARGVDAKEFVNAVQKSLWGEPTQDAMPILEDERGILECKVGGWRYIRADEHARLVEAARAEGAKAERERCAGIAKAMSDGAESRMKMGSDSRDAFDEGVSSTSKVILRRILNPTT